MKYLNKTLHLYTRAYNIYNLVWGGQYESQKTV